MDPNEKPQEGSDKNARRSTTAEVSFTDNETITTAQDGSTTSSDASPTTFEQGKERQQPGDEADAEASADATQEGKQPEDGADAQPDASNPVAALGEFKPEEAAKWDAHFLKDGQLSQDALSAAWELNAKVGADGRVEGGGMGEQVYSYLASKGLPKNMVQAVEASLVASARQVQSDLITKSGGQETVDKALKWGREGGYSETQRAAFNAAMTSRDPEKMQAALDLAVLRYEKAAKAGSKSSLSPAKDVASGSGSGTGGLEPFANEAEWRKARRALGGVRNQMEQDRQAAIVRERRRISNF